MTRLAGGGATPVKAPPRVRASPKPRYVAPAPVPKPAPLPKPSYVPTKTSSGANPRGVSVPKHAPKPTKADKAANFIGTGANPRGVAIHTPKAGGLNVKQVKHQIAAKAAASQSSGGGGILGAIESGSIAGSVLHTITHIPSDIEHVASVPIIHNTLKDVVNLVPSSIEGVGTIAQAAGHDILGVATGATHIGPGAVTQPAKQHSAVEHLAEQAWKGSVYKPLLEGHVGQALAEFKQNPLNVALQFTGAAGLVGRTAGIVARTGAVGGALKDAAGLARDDRVLIPGVKGETRHYHPNVIVSAGQHLLDKHEEHRPQYFNNRKINKRVNDIRGNTRNVASVHEADVKKAMAESIKGERGKGTKVAEHFGKQASKGRRAAADVASYHVQAVASHEHLVEELRNLRGKIHDALHDPAHKVSNTARKAAEAHIKNIDEFLADPDVTAVHEIAQNYAARQRGEIDPEMVNRGLLSKAQAKMAPLVPYVASGHMDGVRVIDKAHAETSVRAAAHQIARRAVGAAERAVRDVKLTNAEDHLKPGEADANLKEALHSLSKATGAESKTYGVLLGRHGRDAGLPAAEADRMNRYLSKTNDARLKVKAARAELKSGHTDRRQRAAKYLQGARDNLKEAVSDRKALDQFEREHVSGVVTDTNIRLPGRRADGSPRFAVRRVPAAEIEKHMLANGKNPEDVAYVNLSPPRKPGEEPLHAGTSLASRGDAALRSRTGKEILSGNWKPGHTALADSQVGSLRRIDRAKGFDRLMQQITVHDAKGNVVSATKDTIDDKIEKFAEDNPKAPPMVAVPLHSPTAIAAQGAHVAQAFVDDHGEILQPKDADPNQRFGMAPEPAIKHYKAHVKADQASRIGAIGSVTRAFRNTVLPFSPKWLVGNVVEAAIRSALVGAGPGDAQLFRTVLKTMRDSGDHDAADELQAYTSGLHYGMAEKANEKITGAGSLSKPPPAAIEMIRNSPGIKQLADTYHGLVQAIYHVNRRIEQGFEHAVGGAHMRQQLHEFGHQWTLAASKQDEWIQQLAKGYADPELARDAGRFIQQTLGQYDRFSPTMKKYVNNIAPFAPWYWNALRFVYVTMPGLHPLAQSVLLSAAETQQATYMQQMKDVGGLGAQYSGTSIGSLNSSLALGKKGSGGYLDIGRFTPWGAFSDGPVNFITSQIAPQVSGAYLAAQGKEDAFGNALKDKNGPITDEADAAEIAANELLMGIAGPLDVAHRVIADHGSTEYSGSTFFHTELKPNTHHGPPGILGGVKRVFDPFQPTYLRKAVPSGSAAPASGGYTGGGGSSGYTGGSGSSGYTGGTKSTGFTGGK